MNKTIDNKGKITYTEISTLGELIQALNEIYKAYGDMRLEGGVYGSSADMVEYYPEYTTENGRLITQNVVIW